MAAPQGVAMLKASSSLGRHPAKPAIKARSVLTMRRSASMEIFAVLFTGALNALGALVLAPGLPFFAMQHDATALDWAMITSTYSFCQMVSAPLLGTLSDRIGRRPVLLGGLLASCLLYSLMAEAENVATLLWVRAALGFAGGTMPAEVAYLMDLMDEGERPQWISLQMRVETLGALLGPVLGGALAPHGFPILCRVMGGISGVNFLLGVVFFTEPAALRFARQEPQQPPEGPSASPPSLLGHFRHRATGLLLLAAFLDCFAVAISDGPEAYFLRDKFQFNELDLGKFLMVCSAATLLLSNFVPAILRLVNPKTACVAVSVASAASMWTMLVTKRWWAPYVYAALIAGTSTVVEVISKTILLSSVVPENERGAIYGLGCSLLNAGFTVGPPLGGALYVWTGRGVPYAVSAMFFLGSAITYSLLPSISGVGAPLLQPEQPSEGRATYRALEHCSNEVPLPNKRFAARLQGDQARRVFFVDDALYEHFQEHHRRQQKAHSIGVESMARAVESVRGMRPDVERAASVDMDDAPTA